MRAPFRYSDEEWPAVEACLTKLTPDADAHVRADWRATIERIVDDYLWMTARIDPRSPERDRREGVLGQDRRTRACAERGTRRVGAIGTQVSCGTRCQGLHGRDRRNPMNAQC